MVIDSPRAQSGVASLPPIADRDNLLEALTQIDAALNLLMGGKTNAVSAVTLAASNTTTVVKDARVGPLSHIDLSPLTQNAAGALGTSYISARTKGSFTITHASNTQTDRKFSYAVRGP